MQRNSSDIRCRLAVPVRPVRPEVAIALRRVTQAEASVAQAEARVFTAVALADIWSNANLREDANGQAQSTGCRVVRIDGQRQMQDPRQGGYRSRQPTSRICWPAGRRRSHSGGL
jgi:hypothetical protein